MVRVTSVPDAVLRGAESVTVPFVLFPDSTSNMSGDTEAKPRSLVARMVKFPLVVLLATEKGTRNGVSGVRMLSESACCGGNQMRVSICGGEALLYKLLAADV